MDNKAILKQEFMKLGLPVAKGGTARTLAGARKIMKSLTPPAIVKPYSGSASRHTVLHVVSDEDLVRAFRIATQVAPRAVIEEELAGPVYRATTVNGKFVAALRRDQPHVFGDGTHTVEEMVKDANTHPKRQGPYFHHIKLDETADEELAWQGLTRTSVPAKGLRVTLHQKVNWSMGGTTSDVTAETHPDNIALFEEASRVLGATIAGIDFIISDISRSWKETDRCGILECNSMPFFDNHHLPFEGEPQNVAAAIWDMNA
jgi:cyanophycin synthetase